MSLLAAHFITISDDAPPQVKVYGAADLTDANIAKIIAAVGGLVNSPKPIGKIVVLQDGLLRRAGPGITYQAIPGNLRKNSEHLVYERVQAGKSFWVRIGDGVWCAEIYEGNKKCNYVQHQS